MSTNHNCVKLVQFTERSLRIGNRMEEKGNEDEDLVISLMPRVGNFSKNREGPFCNLREILTQAGLNNEC